MITKLLDLEYRTAFVASQINIQIPFQLRALRKQRGWTQPDLSNKTGMKQPRISAMEKPGGANFTLETLKRLAEAFDVALVVRFAPFSELLGWSESFSPDDFTVPSFEDEASSLWTTDGDKVACLQGVLIGPPLRAVDIKLEPQKYHGCAILQNNRSYYTVIKDAA